MAQKKKRRFFNPAVQHLIERKEDRIAALLDSTAALLEQKSGIPRGRNAYHAVQGFINAGEIHHVGVLTQVDQRVRSKGLQDLPEKQLDTARDRILRVMLIECLCGGQI